MCQMDALTKSLAETNFCNLEESSSNAHDGVAFASMPPKCPSTPPSTEGGKKKRVHRAAKLKQCKMEARREQWLAQVSGKVSKPDSCASSRSSQDDRDDKEVLLHSSPCEVYMGTSDKKEGSEYSKAINGPIRDLWSDEQSGRSDKKNDHPGSGSLVGGMQCNSLSPPSSVTGSYRVGVHADDKGARQTGSETRRFDTQGHTSDTSTSQSNSSQVSSSSDDEENEVEDWEAVADALNANASHDDAKSLLSESRDSPPNGSSHPKSLIPSSHNCVLKPESKYRPRNRTDACRAWRPDDALRPETLPRLSKQHSFPLQSGPPSWAASHGHIWGPPPPPSHCPICTEELDTTDSSFLPCLCGFRLCLFCHHRILVGDGRCPGCRKSYNTDIGTKLSRTVSVRPRI